MARNEEKANNLFNKWQTFKTEFHSVGSNRRPLLASECDSLGDAEKWRREIIRNLTKKVALIQNATLGEFKIRDLNDEINKLMKQKHYWEIRIRELGGSDLKKGRQFFDVEGKELPGQPGYRYYGAAKDLPGVRELFAEDAQEIEHRRKKRSRGDFYKHVTPDYYGYRDEDDGVLLPKEAAIEEEKFAEAQKDYKSTSTAAISAGQRESSAGRADLLANIEKESHERAEAELASYIQALHTPVKSGNSSGSIYDAQAAIASAMAVRESEEELVLQRKQALLSMLLAE